MKGRVAEKNHLISDTAQHSVLASASIPCEPFSPLPSSLVSLLAVNIARTLPHLLLVRRNGQDK